MDYESGSSGDESEPDIENSSSSSDSESSDSSGPTPTVTQLLDQWCEMRKTVPLSTAPSRFAFHGIPGFNFPQNSERSILDYFELFFDEEITNIICMETNRYADQKLNYASSTSKAGWNPILKPELCVFISLHILQAINKKPEEKFNWSQRPILHTPFFSKTMSSRRFDKIKQYLHFSDNNSYNAETHPNPKLNKIWNIHNILIKKFQQMYTPERDITIDESLLLYKGRLGWRQCILSKRARFGIKSYMLCESISGYVWNTIIYTGRGSIIDKDFEHLQMTLQVVMSLMNPLLDKGYCLTTDNFYTSPNLAELLGTRLTDIYGTVKPNRVGMPQQLKTKKLKKGEIVAYQKRKTMVLQWKDKRVVTALSTIHNNEMVNIQKNKKTIEKPRVVVDYNGTMRGVDRVDQHLADYPIPRKRGKKYYRKIFFHYLELSLWNSFVLYKKKGGPLSHLYFRMMLIEELVDKYLPMIEKKPQGRHLTESHPGRLTERHFPDVFPPTETKRNPRKSCVVCALKRDANGKKTRRDTKYYCPECNVALCVTPCFKNHHTVL